MKILLLHNKIIADTATRAFMASVEGELSQKLAEKYGTSLTEIQMYEDYLSDGFVRDGAFYYPLTVVVDGQKTRQWISWNISEKKKFKGQNPFAYTGSEPLVIEICAGVPDEFSMKLLGRASYFEEGLVPLKIEVDIPDSNLLVGKYSQTFVDEMNRQLHYEITRRCAVDGLAESGIELSLAFAPDTYMEHVVENTTYRRLLIKARGCNERDLWIRWTRLNSMTPFTVSNNVFPTDIKFEIAEDVPEKIREREYRYLAVSFTEKYQASMQRKNITEWHELIKRCIKRGELVKCESEEIIQEKPENELTAKLQEALGAYTPATAPEVETVDDGGLANLLKSVLTANDREPKEPEEVFSTADDILLDEPPFDREKPEEENVKTDVSDGLVANPLEDMRETTEETFEQTVDEHTAEDVLSEDELRARLEAEIREKLMREMQEKAEAEKAELLLAHEKLREENERLVEIARRAEAERAANEAKANEEAEKARLEAEAQAHAEAMEREKIEEAARAALLEEQRLAEKRREDELLAQRERLENERARLEAERLEREREELESVKAKEEEKPSLPRYTYVSKNARLLFKRQIDPNVTKRIHEIILATIKYFHKEDIFIKIKATIPDSTTVNLHFEKIPEEENELLINIIKVLGKSDLGITKVFLE